MSVTFVTRGFLENRAEKFVKLNQLVIQFLQDRGYNLAVAKNVEDSGVEIVKTNIQDKDEVEGPVLYTAIVNRFGTHQITMQPIFGSFPYKHNLYHPYGFFASSDSESLICYLAMYGLIYPDRVWRKSMFNSEGVGILRECKHIARDPKPDNDYNEIIGWTEEQVVRLVDNSPVDPPEPMPLCLDDHIDQEVYKNFEELFDMLRHPAGRSLDRAQYYNRMGSASVSTNVYTWKSRIRMYNARSKRQLTPAEWISEAQGIIPAVCSMLPKPSCVKSNGKRRVVFAMPPALEAYQRLFFHGMTHTTLAGYVSNPFKEMSDEPNLQYSYDIKNADHVIGPYFLKYLQRRCTEDELEALFPQVLCGKGVYRTRTLPSGVVHTAIVVNVWTAALLRHLGVVNYQFQGDGIRTDTEISFGPHLKRCEDYTLNGFKLEDGKCVYINTHKLGLPAFMRNKRICGRLRYAVRHRAFEKMNARDLEYFPRPGWGYDSLSDSDLLKLVGEKGCEPSILEKFAFGIDDDFDYESRSPDEFDFYTAHTRLRVISRKYTIRSRMIQ